MIMRTLEKKTDAKMKQIFFLPNSVKKIGGNIFRLSVELNKYLKK